MRMHVIVIIFEESAPPVKNPEDAYHGYTLCRHFKFFFKIPAKLYSITIFQNVNVYVIVIIFEESPPPPCQKSTARVSWIRPLQTLQILFAFRQCIPVKYFLDLVNLNKILDCNYTFSNLFGTKRNSVRC